MATYVAALTVLEHEDGDEARAILAKLEEEGDIDPAPFEHLIKVVVGIDSQARAVCKVTENARCCPV